MLYNKYVVFLISINYYYVKVQLCDTMNIKALTLTILVFISLFGLMYILDLGGFSSDKNNENNYSTEIELVKKFSLNNNNENIEGASKRLAGAKGLVEWNAYKSKKVDEQNLVYVESLIHKTVGGKKRTFIVCYLINQDNNQIEYSYTAIDGKVIDPYSYSGLTKINEWLTY